jgi:integrase
MGSINVKNGKLFLDFRYRGVRCREYTKLDASKVNHTRAERLLKTIEAEIILDRFDYGKYFPKSKLRHKFDQVDYKKRQSIAYFDAPDSPKFEEFAQTWLTEKKIEQPIYH